MLLCEGGLVVDPRVRLLRRRLEVWSDLCRRRPYEGIGLLPRCHRTSPPPENDLCTLTSKFTSPEQDLYNNLTLQYPHAQIWLAGHSLGGGLASLLALTFGIPSVSFESPGDLLPARRLHLPLPPGLQWEDTGVVHVYNTADPIAMGTCNGAVSFCAVAGFALESRCHSGKAVVFGELPMSSSGVYNNRGA
jgi:putative lipase involved disintegration of autophagic bodies